MRLWFYFIIITLNAVQVVGFQQWDSAKTNITNLISSRDNEIKTLMLNQLGHRTVKPKGHLLDMRASPFICYTINKLAITPIELTSWRVNFDDSTNHLSCS